MNHRRNTASGQVLWPLPIALLGLAASLVPTAVWAQEVPEAVLGAEQKRVESIARAVRSAVCVFGPGGKGGGSGVVISADGYALTNFHVAKPAGNHMKCSMADNRLYDAVIVGIDPGGDVALIKLLGRDDFPHAELGDSDKVRQGDWCFAVGNPFLLATDFQPTLSYGIVSGVHRYQYPAGTLLEYADCIQTDAAINPGNSGGPLFNADAQLIGINGRGSFEKRGRVNVGVGYAISINQIKNFVGHLHSGRIVDHATLGATVTSSEDGQVVVSDILESSDAYRRGLRYGDSVVAFGNRPITTVNGFKNALGIFPKGWRVPLSFRRDGERFDVLVRLAGVHSPEELIAKVQRKPPTPGPKPDQPKENKDDNKDGDEKKDAPKKRAKGKEKGKRLPIPIPIPGAHPKPKKAPVPPEIAKLIEVRPGFSNYYFNRLHRDRVWKAMSSHGDFLGRTGEWVMEGESAGGEVRITLNDQMVDGRFPSGEVTITTDADLSEQLSPRGSGGLLAALHLWRRILTLGPSRFGEVYYLGQAPHRGRDEYVDVLVATHDVTETHFLFDRQSGQLIGLEMYPDTNVDPCEVLFHSYQEVDGREIPERIEVRHADKVYGEIQLKQLKLPPVDKKDAS